MCSSRQGPSFVSLCLRDSCGKEESVNTSKGKVVNFSKSLLVSFPKWLQSLRDTQTSVCLCHLRKCNFTASLGISHQQIPIRFFPKVFLSYWVKLRVPAFLVAHSTGIITFLGFLWKSRTAGSTGNPSLLSQKPNNLQQKKLLPCWPVHNAHCWSPAS